MARLLVLLCCCSVAHGVQAPKPKELPTTAEMIIGTWKLATVNGKPTAVDESLVITEQGTLTIVEKELTRGPYNWTLDAEYLIATGERRLNKFRIVVLTKEKLVYALGPDECEFKKVR